MSRPLVFLVAAFASLLLLSCAGGAEGFTYLALGDSLALGEGASDPLTKGYVPLVQEQLGEEAELVNLGVLGETSADVLEEGGQLERALDEIENRDDVEVITLDIGGNDLRALTEEGSPCVVDPLAPACLQVAFPQVLAAYGDNLRQTLQALRGAAPAADIVVLNVFNPFSGSGSPLEAGAAIAIQQFNALVAQVAAEPEVQAEVADIAVPFKERVGEVISPDGIHPNDVGYALIADAVAKALAGRAA